MTGADIKLRRISISATRTFDLPHSAEAPRGIHNSSCAAHTVHKPRQIHRLHISSFSDNTSHKPDHKVSRGTSRWTTPIWGHRPEHQAHTHESGTRPEEGKQAHRIPSGFVFAQQTASCWPWRGWSRNRPRSCYRGELCQPFAALRCAFAPAEFNGACSCQDFFAGGGNGEAF